MILILVLKSFTRTCFGLSGASGIGFLCKRSHRFQVRLKAPSLGTWMRLCGVGLSGPAFRLEAAVGFELEPFRVMSITQSTI